MSKTRVALVALVILPLTAPLGAAVVGKDAAACNSGQPSIQVRVAGFKRAAGTVKVAVYGDDRSRYLAKGGKLRKVIVPVHSSGPIDVCIAVPEPGRYAIAVHHDLNGNGSKDSSDGAGYSGNPRLSLVNLKPSFGKTAIDVSSMPRRVSVLLQYRKGLSVGPVSS